MIEPYRNLRGYGFLRDGLRRYRQIRSLSRQPAGAPGTSAHRSRKVDDLVWDTQLPRTTMHFSDMQPDELDACGKISLIA